MNICSGDWMANAAHHGGRSKARQGFANPEI
jgi:hypothetical protein